jgi:hypothetical protein
MRWRPRKPRGDGAEVVEKLNAARVRNLAKACQKSILAHKIRLQVRSREAESLSADARAKPPELPQTQCRMILKPPELP